MKLIQRQSEVSPFRARDLAVGGGAIGDRAASRRGGPTTLAAFAILAGAAWVGCAPTASGPDTTVSRSGGKSGAGSGGANAAGSGGIAGSGAAGAPGTGGEIETGGAGGSGLPGTAGDSGASGGSGGRTGSGGAAGESGGFGGRATGGAGGGTNSGGQGGSTAMGGAGGSGTCRPGMVPIPAKNQSFMMGLDASEAPLQSNGMPWACYLGKHQVTFTYDYCMDANLVTQAEFTKVMGFNPSKHKTTDATLPVDAETWYDAVLYCNKKSQLDGLQPAYTLGAVTLTGMSASNIANVVIDLKKNGYRLPTNAEYEYAERANTTGRYFFAPTAPANINSAAGIGSMYSWNTYNAGTTPQSQPVGTKKPNPWGLYDIIGNLFEWEHDWEGPYVTTPEVDPVGPAMGTGCGGYDIGIQRMAKGGSWHTDVSTHMRIGYHYKWKPASVHAELGFRCVATTVN